MTGYGFVRIVHEALVPFFEDLGFVLDTLSITGRDYGAAFRGPTHMVSISLEPDATEPVVIVFTLAGGNPSDIDDRRKSPRLADLNKRFMSRISMQERLSSNSGLAFITGRDDAEQRLLKAAKELRLVLPIYLSEEQWNKT
jgi:hypothetical protein